MHGQKYKLYPTKARYITALKLCANAKSLADAKWVHAHIIGSGYAADRFMGNHVMEMYAESGSLELAWQVFETMDNRNIFSWTIMITANGRWGRVNCAHRLFVEIPLPNLVSWNSIIAVYGQNGFNQEAFQLFHQMQISGMMPNNITCITLLDSCTQILSLAQGKWMHAFVIYNRLDRDVPIGNALLNMYGKCGCLSTAIEIFHGLITPNVVSWTSLISLYTQHGHADKLLQLFHQMKLEGLMPNKVTYVSLVDGYAAFAVAASSKLVHAYVLGVQYGCDAILGNALIHMYGNSGNLIDAERVFDKMSETNVVSWTTMIAAYTQSGCNNGAIQLFQQIEVECLALDMVSYVGILDACHEPTALAKGRRIHSLIIVCELCSDTVLATTLTAMYGKCDSIEEAKHTFERTPQLNIVAWNAMISCYMQHNLCEEAIQAFEQMQLEKTMPDAVSISMIADAYALLEALQKGRQIHTHILKDNSDVAMVVGNALIHMYGNCGTLEEACLVFDNLPERNLTSWNTLISAFIKNSCADGALQIFEQMKLEGFSGDKATVIAILDGCATLMAPVKGKQLHAHIVFHGLESDASVNTALMNMYGINGNLTDVNSIFNIMEERNLISWTAIMSSYMHYGLANKVFQLLQEMQNGGTLPNEITLVSILSACSHAGLITEGLHIFFAVFQPYSTNVTYEHYGCMVNALAKGGHLDEAEDFIIHVPFYYCDATLWTSLLCAAYLHCDIHVGIRVTEYIAQMDPFNTAPKILLSNLYAAHGMWNDVERVRVVINDLVTKYNFPFT